MGTCYCSDIRALLNGRLLELANAEYRLLCLLGRNVNRVDSEDIILNDLWDGTGNFVDDNTLSVYVRQLREEVEAEASHPQHLITVRGFGYQWKAELDISYGTVKRYRFPDFNPLNGQYGSFKQIGFVNGVRKDIDAVRKVIELEYNNGLAEGSVNK